MELNVELKCLDTKRSEHIKLSVVNWDSKCVKDLKEILEDKIQVPSCDQKLYYQGRPLRNDNSFPLKKLYLREGDTILVECIAQGNLAEIKELLKDVKKFSNIITSEDQTELLTVDNLKKDDRSSYVIYDYIAHALDQLSLEYFIPWKNAKSVVHRHYFVQEGGFDAFMEVLKFASRRYTLERKPMARKFLGKSKEHDFEVLVNHLRILNDEQMILHTHCLSLLWNFSETWHDRRLVMQKGGLPYVIKALLSDPDEYSSSSNEYWQVTSINETAVGCLVQYAEFPDCQEVIARSSETVSKLMFMMGTSSQFSFLPESTPIITYTEYASQIAANTLFCCACSLQTPKILVENGMHKKMIDLIQQAPKNDLAISYYCTLFMARIRSCALVHLDHQTAQSMDDLIALFLEEYSPNDVSIWEERHNYVWVTMIPFVSLAFSGKQFGGEHCSSLLQISTARGFCKKLEQEQTDGPNLLPAANQCDVMEKKGYTRVGVLNESAQSHSGKLAVEHQTKELLDDSCTNYDSKSCIAGTDIFPTMLGSTQTQQLGLFTLQHMLQSSENRQLVEGECLLPYLYCLCWYVSSEEGRLLKAELTKHWSLRPAPLKIICKSILAFVYGFEAAFRM